MIRGVFLKVEENKDRMLWEILKCIDIPKYHWYNIWSQYEARGSDYGEEFLEDDYYEGSDFLETINQKHYIIFLKLEAYLEKTDNVDIHTYEEFWKSDCKILILIADCTYIEIYAKEESVIKSIYGNARKGGFCKVEYITDMNDGRTKMDVL